MTTGPYANSDGISTHNNGQTKYQIKINDEIIEGYTKRAGIESGNSTAKGNVRKGIAFNSLPSKKQNSPPRASSTGSYDLFGISKKLPMGPGYY